MAARQEDVASAVDSVGGMEDPGGVGVGDALVALSKVAVHGGQALKATAGLAAELGRVVVGRSAVEPAKGDRRFNDPTWTGPPGLPPADAGLPRLVGSRSTRSSRAADVDWRTRERARFAAGILTSPSRRPTRCRATRRRSSGLIETGGGSLFRGPGTSSTTCCTTAACPSRSTPRGFTVGREPGGHPGRGRLPQRGLRAHPVHSRRRRRSARPAGPDGPAADQQVLLRRPGPGAQLRRARRQPGPARSS